MNLYDALDDIRQKSGESETTSYTRNGCRVSLAKIPQARVVLDVDIAFPVDRADTSQCDLVLFYVDARQACLVVVPMELKRGNVDASEVIAQLQGGMRLVERLLPTRVKTRCMPVLVHGRRFPTNQRREWLKISNVNFRGQKYPVNTTRCGYEGNLAKALNIK